MGKGLLILLIIAAGAAGYLYLVNSQAEPVGGSPSINLVDEIQETYRSWDAIQAAKQPPDDGTQIIGENEPNSDVSQCEWSDLSADQKITTQFGNYILEYPCIANHKGSWRIVLDQNDNVIEQQYKLNLRLLINEVKGTIWQQEQGVYEPDDYAIRLALSSSGQSYSQNWLSERFENAELIEHLNDLNLSIYADQPSLYAVITDEMQDFQNHAFVSCSWGGDLTDLQIFSAEHNEDKKLSCDAFWMLNDSIRVRWTIFDSSMAYRFNELYRFVNSELQKIVVGTFDVNGESGDGSHDLHFYNQRAATDN